jgi:hypothetical protein
MSYRTDIHQAPSDTIIDLAPHWNKLSNYEDISDDLSEEDENKIVDYVRACGKLSHSRISRRYDSWRDADRAHDVYVPPNTTDFREKAVISDTRAVAETVLTYQMSALTGRNPMFQLEGLNRRSRKPSMIIERILHQQMRRTAGEAKLAQNLLDSIRYGFAPSKVVWDQRDRTNNIINFDPYRTFPDPRVTWGDWDRMQFILFTDLISTSALIASGKFPKLKRYPALRTNTSVTSNSWEIHRTFRDEGRGLNINPTSVHEGSGSFKLEAARTVDEMWFTLNGYQINMPGIETVWLVVTILDEKVAIDLRMNPYGRQFPISIGGLYYDSQSLYDLLMPVHEIATWLLRSRIDNVRASLNNLIFVDPTQVNIADLIDRNPWGIVQTLPGTKPGDGVFIAKIPDVTSGHWNDIAAMAELKNRVSAASDAQQGMPISDGGVRSATEIQRLSQMGSQRLGVLARSLSATNIRPMARLMVSNIQDALEYEGSIRMSQTNTPGPLTGMVEDGYLDFDIGMLQGDIEYLVVDGTLPTEPSRNAETWMNMLSVINNTGLQMEYKTGRIVEEAIRALGVSDIDQFKISPEEAKQGMTPSQQMAMLEASRGASVKPAEEIDRELEKGNVVPIR